MNAYRRVALRKGIVTRYVNSDDPVLRRIASYVANNGVTMIPFEFRKRYEQQPVQIEYDAEKGLRYAHLGGKKIYFPKGTSRSSMTLAVRQALIEQDDDSPHRYLAGSKLPQGDIAILIGASDSIYCLEVIDKFQKVYLFEADEGWIPAMKSTLQDYLHKVVIVQKFVSDVDNAESVRLDTYFRGMEDRVSYIQADIEGNEEKLLLGAQEILKQSEVTISICCYHTVEQLPSITRILEASGYYCQHSKGYMLLYMQTPLVHPFLRRGVVYARRRTDG